jgi:glycosyltransferase involved in cell wall biosynthesis
MREGDYGSITKVGEKFAEHTGMDKVVVNRPATPILSRTFLQNISIPRKLRKLEKEYSKVFIPSYELLTNTNPRDYNLDFYVYVHDLYRVFGDMTVAQRLNTVRGIKNFSKCQNIIANSGVTATVLEHTYFLRTEVDVVPPGIDEEFYPDKNRPDIDELPEKYILYVGSFTPRKNTEFLLEVLEELPEDIYLVTAGDYVDEENFEDFKEKSKERGLDDCIVNIGYLEEIAQLRKLYSSAHCYIHPAKRGGFELTPMEAAACGTRVVTNRDLPSSDYLEGYAEFYENFDSVKVAEQISKGNDAKYAKRSWAEASTQLEEVLKSDIYE